MKKILVALLSICILISVFAGCSSNSKTSDSLYKSYIGNDPSSAPSAPPAENNASYDSEMAPSGSNGSAVIVRTSSTTFEKIIYTADAEIETVEFDKSVSDVYNLLDAHGGFIEESYIGGANYRQKYYDYQTYRNARFTLRIPVDAFNSVISSLDVLGNVTARSSNAENITAQFTDNESRLATYRTEETRLLAMLEKADTVTDMITIETRLSEIRYQVETITSQLKNWQSRVDYSTISLYLSEVEKLSEQVPVKRTYWQQTGDGLITSLKNVGNFFTDLLRWIIVSLPVLLVLAAICVTIIILVKRAVKKRRKPDNTEKSE